MGHPKKTEPIEPENSPAIQEVEIDELNAIIAKTRSSLDEFEHKKLEAAMGTLAYITQEIMAKDASIQRLRRLIFGSTSEKTKDLFPEESSEGKDDELNSEETSSPESSSKNEEPEEPAKTQAPGHGRNSAEVYRKAEKASIAHESLTAKDDCPKCDKGKIYLQKKPAVLVRVIGVAPLNAKIYELERLRCNLCGEIFTAAAPAGVGSEKYDESAASMIALVKYGCGMPFHRLERLQNDIGIPLPSSTQWNVVQRAAKLVEPAHKELIRQAAQGEVIHNDDTVMKILKLATPLMAKEPRGRTGIYTSGIVSIAEGREISLFFTAKRHAGENLADVLKLRSAELAAPIQMSDALAHNTAGDFETILSNCIAHARRKFVEIKVNFPDECSYVIKAFRVVYRNDGKAQDAGMDGEERLAFHQENSQEAMDELEAWMKKQVEDNLVEENSGLGKAIKYTRKHWSKLTLFLREAGAPLDNNICERALKKVILHRKNALFYRTEKGAAVGDIFMSLIHTVERCDGNPFEYLTVIQKYHDAMVADPAAWMPWNYHEALAKVAE